jgi:hypothetical protein
MPVNTLTSAKFGGYDFDTLTDELKARLQVNFAAQFNDFAQSSMAMVLLDQFAYGLNNLAFYLDQRATDNYLVTARTVGAITKLARQLGYKIAPATASTVDVDIYLTSQYAFDVPLARGSQLRSTNGIIFETSQALTFPSGTLPNVSKTVSCYQGQTNSQVFTSTGTPNQKFQFNALASNSFIVSGSVIVDVGGSAYTESKFITFDQTNQFEIDYQASPPTIMFGDGNAGNIPPVTSAITVTYIVSQGSSGRVTQGSINSLVTPLVVSGTSIGMVINNPLSTVGGDDPESLSSIQANAPKVFASRNVAVTQSDFEGLSSAFSDPIFGRVSVARAVSTKSSDTDVELQSATSTITTLVSAPATTVDALVAAAAVNTTDASAQNTTLVRNLNILDLKTTAIGTAATSAATAAADVKAKSIQFVNDTSSAQTAINAITNSSSGSAYSLVNGFISSTGVSTITAADKALLLGYLSTIQSTIDSLAPSSTAINASAASISAATNTILARLSEIGTTTTSGTVSNLISTTNQAIMLDVSALSTALGSCQTTVDAAYTGVQAQLASILSHYNALFSMDARSNIVTVPILSKDIDGFYAAPSMSLILALQSYLDARKEVTQGVVVTSGSSSLVYTAITIRLGIDKSFIQSAVVSDVTAKVDTVLKNRKFGQTLYLKEIYDTIYTVDGVKFANVKITGISGFNTIDNALDSDGNLVVKDTYIVTKDRTNFVVNPETYKGQ